MKIKTNPLLGNKHCKVGYLARSQTPLILNSISRLQQFTRNTPFCKNYKASRFRALSSCPKIKTKTLANEIPSISPGPTEIKTKKLYPRKIGASLLRTSSPTKIFHHNLCSFRTQEENDEIRYRLNRFIHSSHKRNEETINYAISHRELSKRFSNLALQINSLLDVKQKIKELTVGIEEPVHLTAGRSGYFRIYSKEQLKIIQGLYLTIE